jgi:predicted TIM-barrel fold metal-dependent hydrolase
MLALGGMRDYRLIHDGLCRGDQSSSPSALSRRRFLASLLAAGASSLLAANLGRGERPELGGMAIDVHHHVFPPPFLKATESLLIGASRARMVEWSTQRSLTEMDATGVRTAIVSITSPGIWFGTSDSALRLARQCNDYLANLARDYPERFGFFAAIPLPDTKQSLREVEYALTVLKADGVGLMTNYGEKWPGDPAFRELFEELNRRKAVVYVHPTTPKCCGGLLPGVPDPLVEFPHDTTRSIVSLLYSGTLTRCPDIRFIFSHAGGTIPMLSGRLKETGALFGMNEGLPNGPEYELKRLHYEIANSAHRTAFAALRTLVSTSQVLFGTDYPFIPMSTTAQGLANLGLPTSDVEAIKHGNAAALFPRIKV